MPERGVTPWQVQVVTFNWHFLSRRVAPAKEIVMEAIGHAIEALGVLGTIASLSAIIIGTIIGLIALWRSRRKRGTHVFPDVTPIARESLLVEGRMVKQLHQGWYEVDLRDAKVIPIKGEGNNHQTAEGWHFRTKSNTYIYRWSTNTLDLQSPSPDT